MLRLLAPELAGAIILGAGSKNIDATWPDLTGKEVFFGCGQQDDFFEIADETQKRLAELGATVTFESWPDVGHSTGDIAGLRRWLFEQTVDRPTDEGFIEFIPPPTSRPPASLPTTSPVAAQRNPDGQATRWFAWAGLGAASVVAIIAIMMWCRRKRTT
jgi:hypothetical protein